MLVFGLLVAFQNQIERRTMRKFRRAPEAAVTNIEKLGQRTDLGIDDTGIEGAVRSGKSFGLSNGIGKRFGRTDQIRALIFERVGNREKHAAKSGTAHLVFRRIIRAAKKRLAVG